MVECFYFDDVDTLIVKKQKKGLEIPFTMPLLQAVIIDFIAVVGFSVFSLVTPRLKIWNIFLKKKINLFSLPPSGFVVDLVW